MPILYGSIDHVLSSAKVGGAVTIISLALLFWVQALHWARSTVARRLRQVAIGLGTISFALVIVLISARFLIIK